MFSVTWQDTTRLMNVVIQHKSKELTLTLVLYVKIQMGPHRGQGHRASVAGLQRSSRGILPGSPPSIPARIRTIQARACRASHLSRGKRLYLEKGSFTLFYDIYISKLNYKIHIYIHKLMLCLII